MAAVPVLVLVHGPPGAGKTTLGHALASALGWPLISKDLIKEALMDSLPQTEPGWSRLLGAASFAVLTRLIEAQMRASAPIVIDAPFHAHDAATALVPLMETYHTRVVQVYCTAPAPILIQRYRERDQRAERHVGHRGSIAYVSLEAAMRDGTYDPLPIGTRIDVDTADWSAVDATTIVASVREAIAP